MLPMNENPRNHLIHAHKDYVTEGRAFVVQGANLLPFICVCECHTVRR